jgi:HlyD family secretion protein
MQQSVPVPQKPERIGSRKSKWRWRNWMLIPLAILVIGALVYWRSRATQAPATTTSFVTVTKGNLSQVISGSGSVSAARTIDVPFQQVGTITAVDVRVGEYVTKGQFLASIDDSTLQLALQQAQASLKSAEASYKKALEGGATEQEIATARAQLASAQAQLEQVRKGNATAADIQSAQAQLASAQAQLEALKNPSEANLIAAETTLAQAQTNLQTQRDSLSQAKTNAYNAMQVAVNSLTQAQSKYSTAKQQWDYVQETGADPTNPTMTNANGESKKNKLSDAQRQQYYDAYVQAEAALRNAELNLQQAQVAYDMARQNEANQIPLLEQQVANAQAQLDALKNPSPSAIAQAQAAVTQAQANLTKLRQGGTAAEIAQSEAAVAQAQANLESLTSPSSEAEIAQAEATLLQAKVALATAEHNLAQAKLTAPIDGVVSAVNIQQGALSSTGTAAITIIDISTMHINVNLSETDAAQVEVGQNVTLTFDALPDVTLEGKVATIAPAATTEQNVVTYAVQIEFDPGDAPVKVGMSATVDIQVKSVENALVVPSRAITTRNNRKMVMLVQGANQPPVPVEVTTGIVSNGQTEITGVVEGAPLKEGDRLLVTASTTNPNSSNNPMGGPGRMPGGMPGFGPPSP